MTQKTTGVPKGSQTGTERDKEGGNWHDCNPRS